MSHFLYLIADLNKIIISFYLFVTDLGRLESPEKSAERLKCYSMREKFKKNKYKKISLLIFDQKWNFLLVRLANFVI